MQTGTATENTDTDTRAGSEGEQTSAVVLLLIAAASAIGHGVLLGALGVHVGTIAIFHLATLIPLALVLLRAQRHGHDVSIPLLATLSGVVLGPFGVAGAAILGLMRRAPHGRLLDQWYERISQSTNVDPVVRLSDDVSVGRSVNLLGAMPSSFQTAMERGSISEQQTVLGMIARRFHPDYLPILQCALKCPEPIVRVQAAAVAARIRPELARRFHQCLVAVPAATASGRSSLDLLQRIEAYVASGLIDEGDRQRGLTILDQLGDVILDELRRSRSQAAPIAVTEQQNEALERLLIRRGAYRELRSNRSASHFLEHGARVRVRRLGKAQVTAAIYDAPEELSA